MIQKPQLIYPHWTPSMYEMSFNEPLIYREEKHIEFSLHFRR